MFGKKKRIIETQKALIADLRLELEHREKLINFQTARIFELQNQLSHIKAFTKATDIDFPNSEKGGSSNTGAVNVSDILNL